MWYALALTASLQQVSLQAQEFPLASNHPGSWSAPDVRAASLPPAAKTAGLAVAQQILDILHKAPVMSPAPGFAVVTHTFLALDNGLITVRVTANLAPYERTAQGVRPNERDTAATITVVVNDFSYTGTTAMGEAWRDDLGAFIHGPEDPVETQHGFPVYQEGNGDKWLLMRRRDVPVVAPVSRERYLLCLTMQVENELAKIEQRRAKIPPGVPASIAGEIDAAIGHQKRHLANLQRQYQQMSAADRRQPAIVGASEGESPVNFAVDGTAIVYLNPALVDATLPTAAPQAISVHVAATAVPSADSADALDRQLDWAALKALLR
jgi:hypothetical protein